MSQSFQLFHRTHAREVAFVPVDPYKPNTSHHILSQIIRQIYRHVLLRLPSIYFSRVSRVFEDAEVSRPEVERMVEGLERGDAFHWPSSREWVFPNVSRALVRFKESWESFVNSVSKEWKTLNVVSALLLTAILTILQIQGASTTPVVRTMAFLSLICALMSLVYGCVYILRFGTMKDMYHAARWAEGAHRDTSILWNIWVLLAMPAVWMAWALIFFCVAMLNFVWDQPFSSPSTDNSAPTFQSTKALAVSLSEPDRVALAPRIIISFVFLLGLVYFVLAVRTFRRWGDKRPVSHDVCEGEHGDPAAISPNSARGAPSSPGPSLQSHFSTRDGLEMGDDEKMGRRQHRTERRAYSADSAMV